ncbi:MAG: NUDIX hydrolase [Micrococcaceae bacterium]
MKVETHCSNKRCLNDKTNVYAAGGVCWRIEDGDLQILLIHRPNYKDWSLPKGKVDKGETLPQTAVREIREETGLKVRLGIPLPDVHYQVGRGYKHISYWACEAGGQEVIVDNKEVDKYKWLPAGKALKRLTQFSDQPPVMEVIRAYKKGYLKTWPFIMVRHAKAKPRSAWARAEGDRPLAATGRKQAEAVGPLLTAWTPTALITSPWLRCYSTLEGYSKDTGIKLKTKPAITEKNHERSPEKVVKVLEKYMARAEPIAICSHRPVFPTIVETLKNHATKDAASYLPTEDPWLKPGEVIVSQMSVKEPGRIVSIEMYKPSYDYG